MKIHKWTFRNGKKVCVCDKGIRCLPRNSSFYWRDVNCIYCLKRSSVKAHTKFNHYLFKKSYYILKDNGLSDEEIIKGNFKINIEKKKMTNKEYLKKEEVRKVIDEAEKSSGFVGIGEWRDDDDLEIFNNLLKKLKKRLNLENGN